MSVALGHTHRLRLWARQGVPAEGEVRDRLGAKTKGQRLGDTLRGARL